MGIPKIALVCSFANVAFWTDYSAIRIILKGDFKGNGQKEWILSSNVSFICILA